VRDYIHVNDLAAGHVAALDYLCRTDASLLVNLGTAQGISVNEMVAAARRITGRPIPAKNSPRRPGDAATVIASSKKAAALLGWIPRYSDIDTLVESTWKVYRL
jgi:UDP-glucose 4-epimerase